MGCDLVISHLATGLQAVGDPSHSLTQARGTLGKISIPSPRGHNMHKVQGDKRHHPFEFDSKTQIFVYFGRVAGPNASATFLSRSQPVDSCDH